MSTGFFFGSFLAIYYFVGRWTFARLEGDYERVPFVEQPRFWLVAALVLVAMAVHQSRARRTRRFRAERIDLAIIAFLSFMLLSSIWAPDRDLAATKGFEISLMLVVALVVAASRSDGLDDHLHLGFWTTIVVIGTLLGALALVNGNDSRAYAPGGGPNTFGRNMGLTAVGALYIASRYGVAARLAGVVIVAMAALLVMRSGSRGGLLAFSTAAAVYTITANTSSVRKIAIIGAMAAATAAALFYTDAGRQAVEVFQGRIVEQTVENRYLAGRDELWGQAVEMAMERPLFGWGLDGFRAQSWNYPHNLFLEVMVEGGMIGLVLLLGVGWAWWMQCKRGHNQIPRGPLVALVLTLTAAQTSGDLFDSRGVFLLAALAIPSAVVMRRRAPRGKSAQTKEMPNSPPRLRPT
jgi:O-antigen ligase